MSVKTQEIVQDHLKKLASVRDAQRLFTELNYTRDNKPLPRQGWPSVATDALAEGPTVIAHHGDFRVIYSRLKGDRLSRSDEREVVSQLIRNNPYALYLFSDNDGSDWHFLNVKIVRIDGDTDESDRNPAHRRVYRRFTVGPDEKLGNRLRTASQQLAKIELAGGELERLEREPITIQAQHDEAFNVEVVTEEFFDGYKRIFADLQEHLVKQAGDHTWAHDFALQVLNRILFLYFVQRKRWLGDDSEFMVSFWNAYRKIGNPDQAFYRDWLRVLFFEAFNRRFSGGHTHFPPGIRAALLEAPYLNGGLFSENELDRRYSVEIDDAQFKRIFDHLNSYNFTISEDSPLDQEVAVDPEMIGKVYESLVNVRETSADQRSEAGIFYTPRVEIDLMCRLTVVDYLTNHLGDSVRNPVLELVFALDPADKTAADRALDNLDLWPEVDELLRNVAVVDPACGSGSFLVGMLQVLDDLCARANNVRGKQETAYERRTRIIGDSLYGVDVMDWAVHVAELRLWLQLVIETVLAPEELTFRPLLPSLSFKVRQGDSLVQVVGGLDFTGMKDVTGIPPHLKGRLTRLKGEKLKFFYNDSSRQFKTIDAMRNEELGIFRAILDARISEIEQGVAGRQRLMSTKQLTLPGQSEANSQMEMPLLKDEIARLNQQLTDIRKSRALLSSYQDVPFVWQIAFPEVLASEKGGFDIVIGNPPYVRQEEIADPTTARNLVTLESKKLYKARLADAVYQYFPRFFRYRASTRTPARTISGKSDLYIYFFYCALALVNRRGSFAFLTSNSWLDVGYGAGLQEFLLRHSQLKLIIDNEVDRSFSSADINTVISILKPIDEIQDTDSSQMARFVMFRVPFEAILSPIVFEEIFDSRGKRVTPEYRSFSVQQSELLSEGSVIADHVEHVGEETDNGSHLFHSALSISVDPQYAGNKWGGKYLRSPDIYWTVLEKGRQFTRSLSELFVGERYLNTGGADGFFILTDVEQIDDGKYFVRNRSTPSRGKPFEDVIESNFLVPLVKDITKRDKRIEIVSFDAYCFVPKGTLSQSARDYVRWGETQGYNKSSVTKSRRPWYKPTNQMLGSAEVIVPRSFNDTFVIHYNPMAFLTLRFYRLHVVDGLSRRRVAYLNSSVMVLILETLGNKSLGQGAMDFFMADFLALRIPVIDDPELDDVFMSIKGRPIMPVAREYGADGDMSHGFSPPDDRVALDGVVFDALGLTTGERDAVYEATIQMVEARVAKAKSVGSRSRITRTGR